MTGLAVRIDREAGTPPLEQLELQLAALIEQGTLRAGDKLPTVRRLADDLGLAANTVARAYRDLEARGLVDTRGRSGTFVAGDDVDSAARQAAGTIELLIELRKKSRADKNFTLSDKIRDDLKKLGIQVKDGKDGEMTYSFE